MAEGGHDGAWYCGKRPQFDESGLRNFCPPEGCPKGYCALDAGWHHGEPSPREVMHYVENPERGLFGMTALPDQQENN